MLPLLWCEKMINKDGRRHKSDTLCFDRETTNCLRCVIWFPSTKGEAELEELNFSRAMILGELEPEKQSTRAITDRFPKN